MRISVKPIIMLFLVAIMGVSGCMMEMEGENAIDLGVNQEAFTAAQWKALSQTARNGAILDRAGQDLGQNVGLQCKPWVSLVVSSASTGVASTTQTVTSPTNMTTNANGWAWYQPSQFIVGMSTNIRYVQPGWIIQMRLHDPTTHAFINPHTAIVQAISGSGVTFVDSNYVGTNTVGTHYMTFSDFEARVLENGVYQYSVYYVGGG